MSIATDHDQQNLLGGLLFICYIIAALVLTGWIVLSLSKASSLLPAGLDDRRHVQQVFTISSLAAFSFASLSYHMLSFLITSYHDWAVQHDYPLPQGISRRDAERLHLWQWTKTSTLFQDFAKDICAESNGNWWWTEHALILSIAWNLYMAVEGISVSSRVADGYVSKPFNDT